MKSIQTRLLSATSRKPQPHGQSRPAWWMLPVVLLLPLLFFTGCETPQAAAGASASKPAATAAKAIRINAGATEAFTDAVGNLWLPDQGFVGGKTANRGAITIAGTQTPDIYRTEHYGMTAFSQPVPNGAYLVRLHFAETYNKITAKGQRVFSVTVGDKEIKDLDILAKAGAPLTAWVENVKVTVTQGTLNLTFKPGVQNPAINAIEIIPQ